MQAFIYYIKEENRWAMAGTIVIYTSKRGSTKQYAEWIAEELDARLATLEECKFEEMIDYDVIIYGGWLRGSGIVGFNKFKDLVAGLEDRVILYVTGISEYNPANYMQICEINFDSMEDAAKMQLYFCPGRYDVKAVKGLDKLMMSFAKGVLKGGKTPEGASDADKMIKAIQEGIDKVDSGYIKPIIKSARKKLAAAEAGEEQEAAGSIADGYTAVEAPVAE